MRSKVRKKRPVTLIEIMIVIFLIGLIGSVLAFNLKGSLDEGKVFKTVQGKEQITNILMFALAQGESPERIAHDWKEIVKKSSLAGKPEALLKDGWGEEYQVVVKDNDIIVYSQNLERHEEKHRSKSV